MKQDVTVEGIPNKIDHKHEVNINIHIDEETALNVTTAAVSIIGAMAAAYVVKQTSNYTLRAIGDVIYRMTWKIK
jgi:hypothetical protein